MADQTGLTQRQLDQRRHADLVLERAPWLPDWQEIAKFMRPRSIRVSSTDRNIGGRRDQAIYDNAVIVAARTLASGMMSGMTSPARPWFRTKLEDTDLMKYAPVKSWLFQVDTLIRDVFAKSNTYNALHQGYTQLGLYGTWACFVQDDFEDVLRCFPMLTGEYAMDANDRGVIDTVSREMRRSVGQLIKQFGRDACSQTVRNLYDRHNLTATVPVIHLVEPNPGRDPARKDSRSMPYRSVYFETGANSDSYLSQSGYKGFPMLAPRWEVEGQDIYGVGPGYDALGDVKQLQQQQLRKSQAIDYQTNPPIQVPTAYKDSTRARLPGGVMYVDAASPTGGVRNAFEVPLRLDHLKDDINEVRDRVRQAFYADLFLMLAQDTRSGVTATEVAERHEEKMLMLGPVLERLQKELLSPLIDKAFNRCAGAGILPPPPPELQGMDTSVEFISTLAQAQRAVSAQGIDRMLGTVGSVIQVFPHAADKIDIDAAMDEYADLYGINPDIIVPTDKANEMRAQRAQQQQIAGIGQAAPELAKTAQTLGATDANGMQDVLNRFTGYGTPSPQDVGV